MHRYLSRGGQSRDTLPTKPIQSTRPACAETHLCVLCTHPINQGLDLIWLVCMRCAHCTALALPNVFQASERRKVPWAATLRGAAEEATPTGDDRLVIDSVWGSGPQLHVSHSHSRSRASQHAIDTMVYTAHVKKHGKHGW
jgi:hypothetical protein